MTLWDLFIYPRILLGIKNGWRLREGGSSIVQGSGTAVNETCGVLRLAPEMLILWNRRQNRIGRDGSAGGASAESVLISGWLMDNDRIHL